MNWVFHPYVRYLNLVFEFFFTVIDYVPLTRKKKSRAAVVLYAMQ